jgi:hypothetical protein
VELKSRILLTSTILLYLPTTAKTFRRRSLQHQQFYHFLHPFLFDKKQEDAHIHSSFTCPPVPKIL